MSKKLSASLVLFISHCFSECNVHKKRHLVGKDVFSVTATGFKPVTG